MVFRRKIWFFAVLFGFLMMLMDGTTISRADAGATLPKHGQAIGELISGNPKKAWEMISEELVNPTDKSQDGICSTHITVIRILNDILIYDIAPPNPDGVARKSYDYVSQHCSGSKSTRRIVENVYANYLVRTNKQGLAIPHLKTALQLSGKNPYDQMIGEFSLSSVYHDMGQFELRDLHRIKAIAIGMEYFRKKREYKSYGFDEVNQYIQYTEILKSRMDNLSGADGPAQVLPEMMQLWQEIERIYKKGMFKYPHLAYTGAAKHFAGVRDTLFARKLLNEGTESVKKYSPKDRELAMLDLQSAEAQVIQAEGKYKESAALFEEWVKNFQRVSGSPLDGNSFRIAGLAQESAQNYDLAIDYLERAIKTFEEIRSSFEVRSRGQFLSGLTVTTYWGLLRSYTARYLKERRKEDFQGAVRVERMLRARQFGELLGIDTKDGSLDISSLKLKPGELFLNYVFTDKAIVVFAITSDWHDLFMILYDRKTFNDTLRQLRAKLSSPGSLGEFVSDVQKVSAVILKPVEGKLSKGKKLIVIPDGYLNGIPFALLSKSEQRYEPLMADHEVLVFPSVSYMVYQRSQKKQERYEKSFFGLGDPAYGSFTIPEEYRDESQTFYEKAVNEFQAFAPLPETKVEVENIASLFPAHTTTKLYGNHANKSSIKSHPLTRYQYLHFATHGILGNQIPGIYEPALVLAAGPSPLDSFLTMSDVEGLKVNSEIAVLSACDTGSGKYYTGEGVMGLGRGFLLAGSKSVLVSLWPISSDATVEFMTIFYKHLLSKRTKSQSLRLTQLQFFQRKGIKTSVERGMMLKAKDSTLGDPTHPFYWAPFVLIGE